MGGDYYDFVPYEDGRLALVVGDVSGKGLPAALMMSNLQARVQMLRETKPDPGTAVRTLNRSLTERCPIGKFNVGVWRARLSSCAHLDIEPRPTDSSLMSPSSPRREAAR